MKKYYAAFFLDLDQTHWISRFRLKHDDKSPIVPPHITLLFPTEVELIEDFCKEIVQLISQTKKFEVRFNSAVMIPEKSEDNLSNYIFLVPDKGFWELLELHDLLYSGNFKYLRRPDIPFFPHITLGTNLGLLEAKTEVDMLNSMPLDFKILVNQINIMEIADPKKCRILVSSIELK